MGDDIDWARLDHNYGAATDVPDLLRRCAHRRATVAEEALGDLENVLHHQGGWVCSAASAALPFLVDLAAGGARHHRTWVVELIWRLAREAHDAAARFVDPGWRPALDAQRPRLLALLADADPRVRREATLLVADGTRHASTLVALRERWRTETDRVTRWDLVHALGAVHAWSRDETVRADLVRLLTDDDLQVRLAAVHALADTDTVAEDTEPATGIAASHVETLVRAVLHPEAEGWAESAWLGGTRVTVVHATGKLLDGDPAAATAYAVAVERSADPDRRVAAVRYAGRLLAEWRTADAALIPFLADHLTDDVAEIRYQAAFLLACLGPAAVGHADRLAALTTDTAAHDSREDVTVGDAAVWALARMHDPRCVPGLVERVTGPRMGFSMAERYIGRDVFMACLPAIREVLVHQPALLDAVTTRLATEEDRYLLVNLCAVLEAWGPAAASAAPVLFPLLDRDDVLPAAARALGAIGPAAARQARALRSVPEVPEAAWALWRTGAGRETGPAALVAHVTAHPDDHTAVRLLADLGTEAAATADVLRDTVRDGSEWQRLEAAHALWRVTGDTTDAVPALTAVARPLSDGDADPYRIAALRHLADMGVTTGPVRAIADAVLDNPRRLSTHGGWHTFADDEDVRAAAGAISRSR